MAVTTFDFLSIDIDLLVLNGLRDNPFLLLCSQENYSCSSTDQDNSYLLL
jgi:hypothetical protein